MAYGPANPSLAFKVGAAADCGGLVKGLLSTAFLINRSAEEGLSDCSLDQYRPHPSPILIPSCRGSGVGVSTFLCVTLIHPFFFPGRKDRLIIDLQIHTPTEFTFSGLKR